jgi:hypothetical protein
MLILKDFPVLAGSLPTLVNYPDPTCELSVSQVFLTDACTTSLPFFSHVQYTPHGFFMQSLLTCSHVGALSAKTSMSGFFLLASTFRKGKTGKIARIFIEYLADRHPARLRPHKIAYHCQSQCLFKEIPLSSWSLEMLCCLQPSKTLIPSSPYMATLLLKTGDKGCGG